MDVFIEKLVKGKNHSGYTAYLLIIAGTLC